MSLEETLPAVEEHLLIYPQAMMYYWVPFSGFGGSSDVEEVRQVARSKVMSYKRVSF